MAAIMYYSCLHTSLSAPTINEGGILISCEVTLVFIVTGEGSGLKIVIVSDTFLRTVVVRFMVAMVPGGVALK